MSRAVKFPRYGGTDVLQLVDVAEVNAGPGEVKVAVVTAGINSGEAAIRQGAMDSVYPAHFPEGQGSDFAGVVSEVGDGVNGIEVGDAVVGFSDGRNAQADYVVLAAERVIPKPHEISWDEAGGLYVAGTTAIACVTAVGVRPGDTVVIAGAAGGVGILTTQLAQHAGARVIATVGESNLDYFRELGVEPVLYGEGLRERIRELAPEGVDAFIDTHGEDNLRLAADLGVDPDRTNTIIDFSGAAEIGTKAKGMSTVDARQTLLELAARMARGEIELPVYASYPLEEVAAAYDRLAEGHGLGKIVLHVSEEPLSG
ncbi:MAG: hypothetical protein JWQ43_161 [Glaciihabitans sp.]|nr:hypothetical protein [Glaciihabitans sp.]